MTKKSIPKCSKNFLLNSKKYKKITLHRVQLFFLNYSNLKLEEIHHFQHQKPILPIFFPLLMNKLGYSIDNTIVFICYKHSILTAKIQKQRKAKFGRIDSCCFPQWKFFFLVKTKLMMICSNRKKGIMIQ